MLGRMYDGIEYRGFDQKIVEELAAYAGVPVWNGLTNQFHPTQILADLLTIQEKFGRLEGIRFTYMGDARNNMGNSLMIGCAKMGLHFTACAPSSLFPAPELVEKAKEFAAASGGSVTLTEDVDQGPRQRGCDLYGYLGLHGGGGQRLGGADQAPQALSGQCQRHGQGRAQRHLHALPALLPRHQHQPSAPKWPRTSALRRWKWPTRSLKAPKAWCSTRRKTGCIPSRRSCTPPCNKIHQIWR